MNSVLKFLVVLVLCQFVHGQQYVGDLCTLESSGAAGTCKLFGDCPKAQEDLRKHRRRPQNCGYNRQDPIVCCPTEENTTPSPPKPETTETPPKRERVPGEVSKRKCREYSAYINERRISPTLSLHPVEITRNECGHKVVKLIVGGEQAGRKEFPHMAAVGYEPTAGQLKWLCGGTILSNRYVLTAAHCLYHPEHGDAAWVMLGVTALNDTSSRKQVIKISERIHYPSYRSSSHYNDIALLKLEKRAKMNPYARPACLYLNEEITAEKAIATGWGDTAWAGEGSNDLLKVTLDLFGHNSCYSSFKNQIGTRLANGINKDNQLCAGSLDEEKDTCQGDSGGPLQIYHIGDEVKCMYDIIGVTSFGKACAGSPGVYTRVSHYVKWIEDIVWP